jgi:lysophospholipase L1-like esterase
MNGDGARGNGAVARENFESKVYHFIGDRLHDICACGNARRKVPSFNFFSKTLVTVRPKITLLGDSITQRAFLPGQWGARLAAHYDRTADVELRGYAGYNSAWIKAVVPTLLAHPVAPALVVVQMGTNDSVHPAPVRGYDKTASRQHVPIAAYKANLTEIIRLIRECGDGSTRILLMTPPPIADERRMQFEGTDILCEDGRERGVLWSDATVEQYVVACQHVARKERIPILNLYAEFKQARAHTMSRLCLDAQARHESPLHRRLRTPRARGPRLALLRPTCAARRARTRTDDRLA